MNFNVYAFLLYLNIKNQFFKCDNFKDFNFIIESLTSRNLNQKMTSLEILLTYTIETLFLLYVYHGNILWIICNQPTADNCFY